MNPYRLEWQTLEHPLREKGSDWYFAVAIIAFSLAIASIVLNNILFAILVLLSAGLLLYYAKRPPALLTIRVDEHGIRSGNRFFSYHDVQSFSVTSDLEEPKILLKSKNVFFPLYSIYIIDVPAYEVREYLSHYLHEEELHEPLSHKVMEYLGF